MKLPETSGQNPFSSIEFPKLDEQEYLNYEGSLPQLFLVDDMTEFGYCEVEVDNDSEIEFVINDRKILINFNSKLFAYTLQQLGLDDEQIKTTEVYIYQDSDQKLGSFWLNKLTSAFVFDFYPLSFIESKLFDTGCVDLQAAVNNGDLSPYIINDANVYFQSIVFHEFRHLQQLLEMPDFFNAETFLGREQYADLERRNCFMRRMGGFDLVKYAQIFLLELAFDLNEYSDSWSNDLMFVIVFIGVAMILTKPVETKMDIYFRQKTEQDAWGKHWRRSDMESLPPFFTVSID